MYHVNLGLSLRKTAQALRDIHNIRISHTMVANYAVALWVCYYNFLRPHQFNSYQVLNKVDVLENADTMPGKWQLLIYLGQKTVAHIQSQQANA